MHFVGDDALFLCKLYLWYLFNRIVLTWLCTVDGKPLSKLILTTYLPNPLEQTSKNLNQIQSFSSLKRNLIMSSAKLWPFCWSLHVLMIRCELQVLVGYWKIFSSNAGGNVACDFTEKYLCGYARRTNSATFTWDAISQRDIYGTVLSFSKVKICCPWFINHCLLLGMVSLCLYWSTTHWSTWGVFLLT